MSKVFDDAGHPILGARFTPLLDAGLGPLLAHHSPLARVTREKRWLYAAIYSPEVAFGVAIVDVGYASNAFAFAADPRPGGRMLADVSFLGAPGLGARVADRPEEGCEATFRAPFAYMAITRPPGSTVYDVIVSTRDLTVHAALESDGSPPPIVAVARPEGSPLMVTQKRALMKVRGHLRAGDQDFSLDQALGGFDYSHGLPARDTRWNWAFLLGHAACGTPVGINLVQGFNGEPECVVWAGDAVFPVGEGRFTFDPSNPLAPWQVRTTCGAVDLSFAPSALHAEHRNLLLVQSHFVQPAGTFTGTVRTPRHGALKLEGVTGVVEDQSVRW